MSKKDLNDIAALEKAIEKKYGKEAIQNPKGFWDKEKEEKYLKELKKFYDQDKRIQPKYKNTAGFKIKTRKTEASNERTCPVCGEYSFSDRDDLYMNKFDCCFNCYIKFVESREERWNSGWRPDK